jgi:hypothetical protein
MRTSAVCIPSISRLNRMFLDHSFCAQGSVLFSDGGLVLDRFRYVASWMFSVKTVKKLQK